MSFESKKEIEMDKLNIKSHLNTSLEAEGISISEDLVNRTLNAIRLNEEKDMNKDIVSLETRKPIFRFSYARTLIMVAAAALVLVVGLNALRVYVPMGTKKDMMESKNITSDDNAGTTEMYSTAKDSAKADYDVYDMEEANRSITDMDMAVTEARDEIMDDVNEGDNIAMLMQGLSFSNIISIEPDDISKIEIASENTGDMDILSENEQIKNFYSLMEKYTFTHENDGHTNIQYIAILFSENGESQINIGDYLITVTNVQDGKTILNIYRSDDHDALLKDITDFLTN